MVSLTQAQIQEVVLEEYRDVLRLPSVEPGDRFTALGGDSLLSGLVAARLAERLRTNVDAPTILHWDSPAALAERLHECQGAEGAPGIHASLPTLEAGSAELPLSREQRIVWFLQQLVPESQAYTFHAVFRFDGDFDVAALREVLDAIVDRHEILRARCASEDGIPFQRIAPAIPASLERREVPADADVRERIQRELRVPFDIERGPLIRWRLLAHGEDRHYLVHSEHHLVHDGLSFNSITEELLHGYSHRAAGGRVVLPDAPGVTYGQYVKWQESWLESDEAARQLRHWRERLAGSEMRPLLTRDRARPERARQRGGSFRIEITRELIEAARNLAEAEQTTPFAVFFAPFCAAIAEQAGVDDINISSAFGNRGPEMAGVVGMFVNPVVLRMAMGAVESERDRVRLATKVIREAQANQNYPFAQLVEALSPPRELSFNPIAQLDFSFHHIPDFSRWEPDTSVTLNEGITTGYTKFDFGVTCGYQRHSGSPEGGERMLAAVEYDADLFEEAEIRRLIDRWLELAARACADPDRPAGEPPPAQPGSLPGQRYRDLDAVLPEGGLLRAPAEWSMGCS